MCAKSGNCSCAVNSLQIYKPEEFLVLDSATVRNLELIKNTYDGSRAHTLFETLDGAHTSMGSRTIKNWLTCPRVDKAAIEQRYDAIEIIMSDIASMQQLGELMTSVGDLERLVGRIALGRGSLADYCLLMRTLAIIPRLRTLLRKFEGRVCSP